MLRCSDGAYYTGVTNDIDARVAQHQQGEEPCCYTFKRRPVELAWCAYHFDVNDAIDREEQIKRWSRAIKEALIAGDMARLSFEALAYERRTFPPLSPEQRK
ncbi:MAG: GIY-YIG nuclease family protein [Flavobacteriales bacterium]|nr:GIY-YIG nuclease family protein [Flavobacteriales bacterium]NUQ15883.1 GIY-YIG nuclease family protein [Flavobacteriales bacterium]